VRVDFRRKYALIALILGLVLTGCQADFGQLRVYSRGVPGFEPGAMQAIFDEQSLLSVVPAEVTAGTSCIDALANGQVDLCRESNSVAFLPGVRAVLPIHKSVLHVLLRDSFEPSDPDRPLKGANILVVDGSSATVSILQLLADRQGLGEDDYTVMTDRADHEPDLVLYLGPIFPASTRVRGQEGYSIVSIDEHIWPGLKITREALRFALPNIDPAVIPALTYDLPGNEEAISTVGVETLLLTREEVPTPVIYELTRTLVEQKPRFSAVSPSYFDGITETFDPLALNFPLHSGARRYLNRDEPSFLERYAETINMLMYLSFLLLSGLIALTRYRSRGKKNRIDIFYVKLMDIRKRIPQQASADLERELVELENEAFALLVEEKLAADESFRIFTDLLARVKQDLSASKP